MSILNKYKHWGFKLKPNKENYWDLVLSKDTSPSIPVDSTYTEECLSAYINFGDKECYVDKFIQSYEAYTWDKAKNVPNVYKFKDESGFTHYVEDKELVPIGIPIERVILLEDIGYTGIDNGLIDYGGWDKISNKDFFNVFTNTKFEIPENRTNLTLHAVTGNTGLYDYDYSIEDGYVKLQGGFYQGFFKLHGFDYQTLPAYIENEWNVEITLRPSYYIIKDNTLNNLYPENSGIFFYIGARAEDKFIQLYNCDLSKYKTRKQPERKLCDDFLDGYFAFDEPENYFSDEYVEKKSIEDCKCSIEESNSKIKQFNAKKANLLYHYLYEFGFRNYEVDTCDTWGESEENEDKTSVITGDGYFADGYQLNRYYSRYINDCDDYSEEDVIISGATLYTSEGELLSDSGYYEINTDNKFLFFNRTKYGFTVANWIEDTVIVLTGSTENEHSDNLYLLMNRTPSGYTTETIDRYYSNHRNEYKFIPDILGNSFAVKYNDNGSISYRYLIKDCNNENGFSILTETSKPNIIKEGEWNTINIKFSLLGNNDDCGTLGTKKMKVYIYVNGYLKFVSKDLPELNLHELKCSKEKQEGVPYNISIGGGTQGLCDSQWLDYQHAFQKILPIEENFAGTFIGDIKEFKFYTCPLEYSQIKSNYFNIIKK